MMSWAGRLARTGAKGNTYKILVGKREVKRCLGNILLR
jgi:hypothetical protein